MDIRGSHAEGPATSACFGTALESMIAVKTEWRIPQFAVYFSTVVIPPEAAAGGWDRAAGAGRIGRTIRSVEIGATAINSAQVRHYSAWRCANDADMI